MDSPGDGPSVPRPIRAALASVETPDPAWALHAAGRQARLTMPPGSLGRLLDLGRQLAAIQRTDRPEGRPSLVAVFVADHGIARAGVSAYPQEVTGQMLLNFLRGGAAINAIASGVGADLKVVDLGVAARPEEASSIEDARFHARPIRPGTTSFLDGPAMSRDEAFEAFAVGHELGRRWVSEGGYRVVALGEMGIGNTTSASALIAALTGAPPDSVVGRGTGLDDAGVERKVDVIRRAIALHGPTWLDLWDRLACLGGFEILGLAGLAVGSAASRALVVLDGLISTAAGLVASRLCPAATGSMVAAHLGVEPGHRVALQAIGLRPLLDLGLRLGEGTGAALALPIIAAAADILRDMATFDGAGVAGPTRPIDEAEGADASTPG
jgi:nicotinate-nucleotide--dimethylbenzimidazole phosphoribosyltransferase